ncbi:subtilisin-like protease [Dorcoceras hygrometricum]|uniref:Subtilisin-like protease n=1 Tax=Dorcoceras hygrometricum TaxID=472368 RepID=A0A2Z7DEV4_9LAMI|nr:subtilisin-like protease [Dorcoceras hygrometricum]
MMAGSDGKLPEKLTVNSSQGNRSHQQRSLGLNNAQTPKRRRSNTTVKSGRSNTLQQIPRYVIKSGHPNAKLAIQISPSSVHQNDAVATYPNDIASLSAQELAGKQIPRYVIKSGHPNAKLAIQISPSSVHQNDAIATYPNDIASLSAQELAGRSHNQILALNALPDLS